MGFTSLLHGCLGLRACVCVCVRVRVRVRVGVCVWVCECVCVAVSHGRCSSAGSKRVSFSLGELQNTQPYRPENASCSSRCLRIVEPITGPDVRICSRRRTTQMAMGQNYPRSTSDSIPTKIGSKMGGAPKHPKRYHWF